MLKSYNILYPRVKENTIKITKLKFLKNNYFIISLAVSLTAICYVAIYLSDPSGFDLYTTCKRKKNFGKI